MARVIERKLSYLLILSAIVCGCAAFPFAISNSWLSLGLWALSCGAWIVAIRMSPDTRLAPVSARTSLSMRIVLIVASAAYLVQLGEIPFHAIGEEIRDGPLYAMALLKGQVSPLGWGAFGGHSNIVPLFYIPFVYFFDSGFLPLRLPTAIIGIADILILYSVARRNFPPSACAVAVAVLAFNSFHWYLARTQLVVLFSSFLTSLLLLTVYCAVQRMTWKTIAQVGLVCGVTFAFHTSVRTVALTVLALMVMWIAMKRGQSNSWRLGCIASLVLGALVGFGPRIVTSPAEVFFALSRLSPAAVAWSFGALFDRYVVSCLHILFHDTGGLFKSEAPLFPGVVVGLAIVGCGSAALQGPVFLRFCLALFVLIPFLNSAISNTLAASHRLAPLLPIGAIMAGEGFRVLSGISSKLDRGGVRIFTAGFVSMVILLVVLAPVRYLLSERINFGLYQGGYAERSAALVRGHLTRLLVNADPPCPLLAISGDEKTMSSFRLLHFKEEMIYFLPEYRPILCGSYGRGRNEVSLGCACNLMEPQCRLDLCRRSYSPLSCPLGEGGITIFARKEFCSDLLEYQKALGAEVAEYRALSAAP